MVIFVVALYSDNVKWHFMNILCLFRGTYIYGKVHCHVSDSTIANIFVRDDVKYNLPVLSSDQYGMVNRIRQAFS